MIARKNRGWGGKREGAGRKREISEELCQSVTVYLTAYDLDYLKHWGPNRSMGVRNLIARAEKFWPKGE